MTISDSYNFDLSRAQLIRTALRIAGVLDFGAEPDANTTAGASDMLNMAVKALTNEGIELRTVERVTTTLTSGTASYTAAADTIDVEFPAYVTPSAGSTTTPLVEMSRDEYMLIPDKTTTGTPLRMYVEKGASALTLVLWPVPDSLSTSITYARVRLARDLDADSDTADVGPSYLKALTYTMAHDLALAHSLPASKCQYLHGIAEEAMKKAVGNDTERGGIQFVVDHRGGAY